MEAGAAERAARGQRRERVTDWLLMGASEYKHVVLGPIFAQAAWSCSPSGSSKSTAASAELLPTSGSSPHTCPSSSASYAGPGLVYSSKIGTAVTDTISHPLVVDLLTVAGSRLHEVINDRMESLTELQTDFAGQ